MLHFQHGELRGRLKDKGMSEADLDWLDSFNWKDGGVPPVSTAGEVADYQRRIRVLNASVENLLLPERVSTLEYKLAASLGAALANWRDRDEDDD